MRVIADLLESQRLGLANQLAENSVAAGQRTDPAPRLIIDADGQEPGESALVLIQNPERRVPSAGQFLRRPQHLGEHNLGISVRNKSSTHLQKAFEPGRIDWMGVHLRQFDSNVRRRPKSLSQASLSPG